MTSQRVAATFVARKPARNNALLQALSLQAPYIAFPAGSQPEKDLILQVFATHLNCLEHIAGDLR